MSDGFLKRFIDNFGKMPEARPPLIPTRWRIPFFIGLSIGALTLLVLLLWLVVLPAIRAQEALLLDGSVHRAAFVNLRKGAA